MTNLYQQFYEKLYFPIFEGVLKRRRTAALYAKALKSQWLPLVEQRSRQLGALKDLLCFAQSNSIYYQKLFASYDFKPQKLTSLQDLSQIPFLEKDTIRQNFDDLVTFPFRNSLWRKSTGGSTGHPLHFGYTKHSYEWRVAMSKRGYSWAGGAPGTKQAYIWGANLTPPGRLLKWKEDVHRFLDRHTYFNCFDFGPTQMAECLAQLKKIGPDVIIGYTNALFEFARYVNLHGGLDFQPRGVLGAAEQLHSFQRETIEKAFNCKVFNTYGSREFMLIASECEKSEGLHVSMENLIVEVVDENGAPTKPGEVGRVLITDLHNYGMPFIRYEIGDLARVSERQCSCGRGLMLLDDIVGRSLDAIQTPEGKTLNGVFFPHLMKEFNDVYRFQIVQDQIDRLVVKLVPYGDLNESTRLAIEQQISAVVGPKMFVSYEIVSEIPLTASGKYRVTVSNLDDAVPPC